MPNHSLLFSRNSMGCKCRAFLMHKPVGVVSSKVDSKPSNIIMSKSNPRWGERTGGKARPTVYEVAETAGFPLDIGLVGRLDYDTSGVILFTDDSRLSRAILHPVDEDSVLADSPFKEKEYDLCLILPQKYSNSDEIDVGQIEIDLAQPFKFNRNGRTYGTNGRAKVSVVELYQNPTLSRGRADMGWCLHVRVVISEGKHHQVRRMARRSGLHVLSLTRRRVAGLLSIDSVPNPGDCRWVTEDELRQLYEGLCINENATESSCESEGP